jgi:hypothetical protein
MKKLILLFAFTMTALFANSQKSFNFTYNGFISVADSSKNYVVIDVPNTAQNKLFQKAKMYLSTLYNNPKYVTSEVDNEQLTIDAIDSKEMKIIFVMNGPNIWKLSYKYVFSFKDNKIKFTPVFKELTNIYNANTVGLIGVNVLGTVTGVFNKNGKCLKEKAKEEVELSVNNFVAKLTTELIKQDQKDNW